METYILSCSNFELVKFINKSEFEIKLSDINKNEYVHELLVLVKNFMRIYNFEIPDDLSLTHIDDFVSFYNGNNIHHRSYYKYISYIKLKLI